MQQRSARLAGEPPAHQAHRPQKPAQVERPVRDLAVLALEPELAVERRELARRSGFQRGELRAQQPLDAVAVERGHRHDDEARRERLVELAGPRVADVHGRDEPRRAVEADEPVAGDVDDPAVVEGRVQDGECLAARHVYLVEHAKPAVLRAAADGAGTEDDPPVGEGVGAQHERRVDVDVEGEVPFRPSERAREVLGEHVLASRLRPGEQQVLPAQQGARRLLPDLFPQVAEVGAGDAVGEPVGCRVRRAELVDSRDDRRVDALPRDEVEDAFHMPPPSFGMGRPYSSTRRRCAATRGRRGLPGSRSRPVGAVRQPTAVRHTTARHSRYD